MWHAVYIVLFILAMTILPGCLPEPPAGTLRIMTYNIHFGTDAADRFCLRETGAVIRRTGAQIICLQEVDRRWGLRSLFKDEAALLAQGLGMDFTYGATLDKEPGKPGYGEYGLCILSRFPISSSDFHLLPSALEQRGILLAEVRTPFGLVPVACIHLGLSFEDRRAQVEEALAWLPEDPNRLLLGDFNTEPGSEELLPLYERFTDLQEACGLGGEGTFNYEGDWVRIDCIFAAPGWKPAGCRVVASEASDHYGVVGEVSR